MKKALKWILRIAITLVVLAALWFLVGIFLAGNHQFFIPLRSGAEQVNYGVHGGQPKVDRLEDEVRVEFAPDCVRFSLDREVIEAEGITPIHVERTLWGIWSYEDFIARYGEPHGDVGSGVFWPAWITDDGYMLTMWLGGEKYWPLSIANMGEVRMIDLLNGE